MDQRGATARHICEELDSKRVAYINSRNSRVRLAVSAKNTMKVLRGWSDVPDALGLGLVPPRLDWQRRDAVE